MMAIGVSREQKVMVVLCERSLIQGMLTGLPGMSEGRYHIQGQLGSDYTAEIGKIEQYHAA